MTSGAPEKEAPAEAAQGETIRQLSRPDVPCLAVIIGANFTSFSNAVTSFSFGIFNW